MLIDGADYSYYSYYSSKEDRKHKIKEIMKPDYFHTLFYFDIETTSKYKDIHEFSIKDNNGYNIFKKKYNKLKWHDNIEESYIKKTPLMHEFNKIVNISFGYFTNDEFRIKSVFDEDEETLLNKADKILTNANALSRTLCGYNIKMFDIPLLNRKYYKYGIMQPNNILTYGKKPWEIKLEDLFEIWRSTGNDFVSLDEVCYILDVESPKSKMSGEDVYAKFWLENDLKSIVEYCEGELKAMTKVAEKLFKYRKH